MNRHRLKLLCEAYKNLALAPTQTLNKALMLDRLEALIEKEITEIEKEPIDLPLPPPTSHDEIPF